MTVVFVVLGVAFAVVWLHIFAKQHPYLWSIVNRTHPAFRRNTKKPQSKSENNWRN